MKTGTAKRMKTLTIALLTIVLVLGSSNFVKSEENTTDTKEEVCKRCMVEDAEIIQYLENEGYSNITLTRLSGSCNVLADTDYSYDTMVYCTSVSITGHEDIDV